jgi:hypothetical protein
MKIFVPEQGRFTGCELQPNKWYEVQDAAEGTEAQNKAFHALVAEYFVSGLCSYPAKSADELKKYIKKTYGAGFDYYIAAVQCKTYPNAGAVRQVKYKTKEEALKNATWFGREQAVFGVLKSWGKYTKAERMKTMDGLISEMLQAGANSKKFEEILKGLEA